MTLTTTRVANQNIQSADLNAIATQANLNETNLVTKAARTLTPRIITGNYTLIAADAIDIILHSVAAGGINITVPQDSAATIAQEIAIPWRQYGTGQITFVAGSGATLLSYTSLVKSNGQYAEGLLTKTAANAWLLTGAITGTAVVAPTSAVYDTGTFDAGVYDAQVASIYGTDIYGTGILA